jgi:hypothetical protein
MATHRFKFNVATLPFVSFFYFYFKIQLYGFVDHERLSRFYKCTKLNNRELLAIQFHYKTLSVSRNNGNASIGSITEGISLPAVWLLAS